MFCLRYPLMWLLSLYELEKVRMRAGLQKQKRQFVVILQPRHQPVRLYVAFPLPLTIT